MADHSLHIVHGVLALDVGGLERVVLELTRAGRKRGHRVSVLCVERPGVLAPDAEANGAAVYSLDKPPGRSEAAVGRAKDFLRDLQPDVVHTHTIGALLYIGRAAYEAGGPPVIHTEHTNNIAIVKGVFGKLKRGLQWKIAAGYCDKFCGVSEDVAASAMRWRAVPASKLDVVLNGIALPEREGREAILETRKGLGIPGTAKVIGTVGRLNEVKRQDLLLRSVAMLRERHSDLHVMLVGDGPERAELESIACKLQISAYAHFVGYQPDPRRYLSAMDVFALTSRHEGLPLAMLEAWAIGLPVLCTSVGGIPKVLADGRNGFLVPSGDESAIAAGLDRLLSDPAQAVRMGAAGKDLVAQKYSLERMASDYEDRYRNAMFARRGAKVGAASTRR
jgi:glycosyltransferase involved in cell wall biosynthesis